MNNIKTKYNALALLNRKAFSSKYLLYVAGTFYVSQKMNIKKGKKYWDDYTKFINEVEKLTELSPAELLSRYKLLIEELKDIDEDYYLEWKYELDCDLWTRQKIQKVIEHELISENILLKNFKEQIEKMDLELKKHILNSDQVDWWNNIELKMNG